MTNSLRKFGKLLGMFVELLKDASKISCGSLENFFRIFEDFLTGLENFSGIIKNFVGMVGELLEYV